MPFADDPPPSPPTTSSGLVLNSDDLPGKQVIRPVDPPTAPPSTMDRVGNSMLGRAGGLPQPGFLGKQQKGAHHGYEKGGSVGWRRYGW